MQRVLVIGAASAIAESTARAYAARGAALFLVGRNAQRLQAIASDLAVRGAASVTVHLLDVDHWQAHEPMLDAAIDVLGGIDVALVSHGTLPDQAACDASIERAMAEFSTNGTSTIALCAAIAPRLDAGGTLAVISSVAGDRGRASNFLYGSAKAAVTAYTSGLRQQFTSRGINVLTVKPGFVDTPMTASFKKGALWASPDAIARGILSAIDRRRGVVYLPWFWWGIMQIIRNVPEPIFRKLKL